MHTRLRVVDGVPVDWEGGGGANTLSDQLYWQVFEGEMVRREKE